MIMNTFGRRLSIITTTRGASVRIVALIRAACTAPISATTAPALFARCSLSRFLSLYLFDFQLRSSEAENFFLTFMTNILGIILYGVVLSELGNGRNKKIINCHVRA